MSSRLRNWAIGLAALTSLWHFQHRKVWAEMRTFAQRLPAALAAPLPQALAGLTPSAHDMLLPLPALRRLADAAALFERRSPLGLCLRRSLVRYHFLRRAGIPLVLNFGARFKSGVADRDVTGHAWLTLDSQPYFEDGENWQGFTVMLKYPKSDG